MLKFIGYGLMAIGVVVLLISFVIAIFGLVCWAIFAGLKWLFVLAMILLIVLIAAALGAIIDFIKRIF